MSALLHLMMGSARRKQTVTRTFNSNETFVIPVGVTVLPTLSGRGENGSSGGLRTYHDETRTSTLYGRNGQTYTTSSTSYGIAGPAPSNYCTPFQSTPNDPSYSGYVICYSYNEYTEGGGSTTGASASGFGRTFPGGVGGPAQTTSYTNVSVTPGATVSVVVPPGGFITITYQV